MGLRSSNEKDPRTFEHLAKVDRNGVVVAMVEVDASTNWQEWTDEEGHRYVYLTDLVPDDPQHRGALDLQGLRLLPKQK